LQFNENEIEVRVGPGATPGSPAIVALTPAQHDLLVENHAITAAAGAAVDVSVLRVPGTRFLRVNGQVPLGSDGRTLTTAVANPALLFAGELRSALERHGIIVDGPTADLDELAPPPDLRGAEVLVVDLSPPLREIADPLLKWSLNIYAEALLMALDPTRPAGAAEGLAVLRTTLESLGVDPASYSTRDGSGLSRNDYLSADALVATLTAMWHSPTLRGPFVAALPQAGKSGSLYSRLRGTPAEGLVWAKTGSMSNVRSLAGYAETAAGETLAFAFLCNGFDVRPTDIDAAVDQLLLALSALPR
jgi:D-alanyl-D-alanine carboxypeptidase/D-alanyl-D-alanine-endopeptidase (penicillin-binding protein 4)